MLVGHLLVLDNVSCHLSSLGSAILEPDLALRHLLFLLLLVPFEARDSVSLLGITSAHVLSFCLIDSVAGVAFALHPALEQLALMSGAAITGIVRKKRFIVSFLEGAVVVSVNRVEPASPLFDLLHS